MFSKMRKQETTMVREEMKVFLYFFKWMASKSQEKVFHSDFSINLSRFLY